jgi:alanine dehydrogenase
MRIGIPTEIKPLEGRIALVPDACGELVKAGHHLFVQQGAGDASGFSDQHYKDSGAEIVAAAESVYGNAELVVKVKEPQPQECDLLRSDHLLFCYLHLAAEETLTRRLQQIGLTAVAFETVQKHGRLPLLAPMSDIAGRIAAQVGCHLLYRPEGGKGLLLGGLPGVARGHVVVLGAGVAGENAVRVAAGLGARITVFDKKRERMALMRDIGPNVTALYPYQRQLEQAVREADLLIGAVLIPGAKAPHLVSRELVAQMEPGSVIVDIAVDQGGCVATTRPTTYDNPTFVVDGVTHFCVANMPGAVPRTASQAISAAIMPYVEQLTHADWEQNPALRAGINIRAARIEYPALLDLFGE